MIMEHLAPLYANAENTIDVMITQEELSGRLVRIFLEIEVQVVRFCLCNKLMPQN